ncbi:hypothetical protein [Parasitella parasitica]|uniref:Uncharacterized protein n=1 Tax=Parasitella parasitica TaxID=35722 RepID=A0A0B7NLD0_9FUNG|nr:hypothetical protein [Parasitella parasitica]
MYAMTISNHRDHPYHFEHPSQQTTDYRSSSVRQIGDNFTWLVFINAKWVPFASVNQHKLEQTLGLGGTFVDIEDKLFPGVKRVRVFPKANYLSYLGVKYRLSRVMQPHQLEFGASFSTTLAQEDEEDESNDPAVNRILRYGIVGLDSSQYSMYTRVL